MKRPRRALLFVPGDARRKQEKAAGLETDGVILDLEDAVAQSRKAEAREAVLSALREIDYGDRERIVRINPVSTALCWADLEGTIDGRPDAYVLPKTESADEVREVSRWLASAEAQREWPEGEIALLALIETARGVVNVAEIATADPRVQALLFGAEDLCGDIGAVRSAEGHEVAFASSKVVIHAAANRLQCLDTPYVDIQNLEGLTIAARRAADAGYTGKMAIHPKHIAPILEAFTPTAEAVAAARRLIDAHDAHQRQGTGVFALDGKMVDMPMVRAAERVLTRARRAGLGDTD